MQICACPSIYRWTKKLWKIRTGLPGHWAFRPPGRRGSWAAGRWAAGLFLAKPENIISNEICELRIFFYRETCRSIYRNPTPKGGQGRVFSNCGLKITYILLEWTSSLLGSVNRRINREQKHITPKRITLSQCSGFLGNQSKFTS